MHMPEAAVYEDYFFAARKHDVRLPRKVRAVQIVFHSQRIQHRANGQFGFGILSLDRRYALASLLRHKNVHHSRQPTPNQIYKLLHLPRPAP